MRTCERPSLPDGALLLQYVAMTEITSVIVAVIAAAVALGGLVTVQIAGVRAEVRTIADRLGALEQRMARIEGVIETLQTILLRGLDHDKDAA